MGVFAWAGTGQDIPSRVPIGFPNSRLCERFLCISQLVIFAFVHTALYADSNSASPNEDSVITAKESAVKVNALEIRGEMVLFHPESVWAGKPFVGVSIPAPFVLAIGKNGYTRNQIDFAGLNVSPNPLTCGLARFNNTYYSYHTLEDEVPEPGAKPFAVGTLKYNLSNHRTVSRYNEVLLFAVEPELLKVEWDSSMSEYDVFLYAKEYPVPNREVRMLKKPEFFQWQLWQTDKNGEKWCLYNFNVTKKQHEGTGITYPVEVNFEIRVNRLRMLKDELNSHVSAKYKYTTKEVLERVDVPVVALLWEKSAPAIGIMDERKGNNQYSILGTADLPLDILTAPRESRPVTITQKGKGLSSLTVAMYCLIAVVPVIILHVKRFWQSKKKVAK